MAATCIPAAENAPATTVHLCEIHPHTTVILIAYSLHLHVSTHVKIKAGTMQNVSLAYDHFTLVLHGLGRTLI